MEEIKNNCADSAEVAEEQEVKTADATEEAEECANEAQDEAEAEEKTSGKENIDYNIMARDIVVLGNYISTSSYAVVHQIDGILLHDSFYKDGKFQLNK